MKVNRSSLFWGILLIAGGGLALAQQMGYLDQLPDSIWMWIFGLVSLVSFISYALSGWRDWGWLFPAGVFGGLAVIVGLAVSGYDNAAIGSPLFFGLLIPFIAAYLTNRANNWWALIPPGTTSSPTPWFSCCSFSGSFTSSREACKPTTDGRCFCWL